MSTSPRGEVLRHQQHLVQQLTGETPALLLTTDAGLEDLVAAEAADRLGSAIKGGLYERRPRGFHGRVLILPPRLDPQMRNLTKLYNNNILLLLLLRACYFVNNPQNNQHHKVSSV